MTSGQKFTKLNHQDAYQQLAPQDEARKYVIVSTNMELLQCTRLPFGVASAPAIFQSDTDNLLRGMRQVVVYLDNILATTVDGEDQLQKLRQVP